LNLEYQLSTGGTLAIRAEKVETQDRPTLIFLHDSLGCIATWRDFPKVLSQSTNCNYLIYDRLGYGSSTEDPKALKRDKKYLEKEADILLTLIEDLEIEKPILFGHSDGGSIALIAAAKREQKIRGIILEAAHIFVEAITLRGIREVKKEFEQGNLQARLNFYHGPKTDTVFNSWAQTWLSDHFQDWNIASFLPSIICPALILQGAKDEFATLKQFDGIIANLSGQVESELLENVGHSPHKENRAEVLRITTHFVNQLT